MRRAALPPRTARRATIPSAARRAEPQGPLRRAAARRPARPVPQMPFIFLVVGLLGGGLVCLLVLNTILASGAFQLTSLQQANTSLAQHAQALQQQIAQEESPGSIDVQARRLGMVPVRHPRFVNLKTGHIYGSRTRHPARHGAIP